MGVVKACRVFLAPSVRDELQRVAVSSRAEHRSVLRARIVLLAARGTSNAAIARALGCVENTVRKWRGRFAEDSSVGSLEDRPRSGRPPEVKPEDRCELLKLACSSPAEAKVPFRDTWTLSSLKTAFRRDTGIDLSRSEIGRILRSEEIRPHRVRYWLHSPDPDFRSKVRRICSLYRNPPPGSRVLCMDEKTCIQALDRKRPLILPSRGRTGRFEFEYRRRGTRNLLAVFEPMTGQMFGRCTQTRTAEDLLDFMDAVAKEYSQGEIYVIWDNLNIHSGPRWEEFNARHQDRFRFVHTPIHASWVNQIEIWFGILERRVLRHGVFESVEQLVRRVEGFLRHWNRHEAHPFRWTFRGTASSMKDRRAA